ncbi:MAG: ribosomal protein S18-alanine N-acetyltransferase [Gemmatimonadetes bacterium]|nr:ribosomal protein S18-alanine N-acetyltransferase [Gemmatimonadota bacterium]NIQ52888.1 ribosomal protein S18-alanine N-acetyltransferase [Gemmatimonadota bacterium]NIU73016.1 ribosomal protein S18-alanine N-acetyltransferase [Gammaproteobacteria bacterium]NIX43362.1 ribosomal protein S18-alanine N-acetyltransferase [Gemmatimonadota bacterium]NIY07535.1 ribosomal protein S18-alanine N-acetyltransferase [Gemmatimonadota bacterium]
MRETAALVIRPMTAADLSQVLAIERASFPVPWTAATFRSLLRRRDAHLWAAEQGGELVGYAVAWVVLDQAELGDIAVTAAARRQGIGTRLLETVAARLAERGVRELFLEVRESNREARRLYGRHEFAEVGRRKAYYSQPREDALVLLRRLTPPAGRAGDELTD